MPSNVQAMRHLLVLGTLLLEFGSVIHGRDVIIVSNGADRAAQNVLSTETETRAPSRFVDKHDYQSDNVQKVPMGADRGAQNMISIEGDRRAPSRFIDKHDYQPDNVRKALIEKVPVQNQHAGHVTHIDAPAKHYIDETHITQPEIIEHQEIIHRQPVDVVRRPIVYEDDRWDHDDDGWDNQDEQLYHDTHRRDYVDEGHEYHHYPRHYDVETADGTRHYDEDEASYHDRDSDWIGKDRESEFEDQEDTSATRSKGYNKELHKGIDTSNVKTSASLTATVTASDSHSSRHNDIAATETETASRFDHASEMKGATDTK